MLLVLSAAWPAPVRPEAAPVDAESAVTRPVPAGAASDIRAATAATAATSLPASPNPTEAALPAVELWGLDVVAGRLPDRPQADPAAAATVIGAGRLAEPQAELGQVLDETVGARVVRSGGLGRVATLSLRGSTPQQVGVYLDGIPLALAHSGVADLGSITPEHLERVEVYRGLAPIEALGGSLGGVVLARSARPSGDRLSLRAGAGSFGTGSFGVRADTRTPTGPGFGLGLAGLQTRGDYRYWSDNGTAFDADDDGWRIRENNAFRRLDGYVRGDWQAGPDWRIEGGQRMYVSDGGLPGNGLRAATVANRDERRWLGDLAARGELAGGWVLEPQVWWARWRSRFRDSRAEFGLNRSDSDNLATAQGVRLLARGEIFERLELAALLAGVRENWAPGDAYAPEPEGPDSHRQRIALGLQPLIALDRRARWRLVPTLRAEHLDSRVRWASFRGVPRADPAPTRQWLHDLRLGFVGELGAGLELRANAMRAQRAPNFMELFGDGAYVLPNSQLEPETGLGGDLGLAWLHTFSGGGWLAADLVGFVRRVDGLIQFEQASPDTVRARNVEGADIAGAEAGMAADFRSRLRLHGNWTWLHGRQRSGYPHRDGRHLPLQPESRIFVRVEPRHRADLNWLRQVTVWGEFEYQSSNFLDPGNIILVPARRLWNAGLALAWLPDDALRLTVVLRNLADTPLQDLLGFPLPGRQLQAGLAWDLRPRSNR